MMSSYHKALICHHQALNGMSASRQYQSNKLCLRFSWYFKRVDELEHFEIINTALEVDHVLDAKPICQSSFVINRHCVLVSLFTHTVYICCYGQKPATVHCVKNMNS